MSQETLRELLARVHERLAGAGRVDQQSRDLLATVMHDIERTLGQDPIPGEPGAAPRLEALAVQFEADHPTLAQALRQLMDALGKAGI